ncbi:MAG TPA: phytanoyl-CoA dioxygenase family protein [Abditibacterium sp.]|jgi:ectoine hydroxylase-related dioxygenase (phytanoyl-CoA dioxygenase family)
MKTGITERGFAVVNGVLSDVQIEKLREVCASIENEGVLRREGVFAIRNLLDSPPIQDLARSQAVRALVEPILGPDCFAVRGIFFDKVPGANWKVPYHQDLSIAVESKIETSGFGPWSEKAGVIHVQPPRETLENMLTVRLHLDNCSAQNGALRVLSGTHGGGKLSAPQIAAAREKQTEIVVEVGQGGALLMRPLLLHASSPTQSGAHRRVIHLEFAAADLPDSLRWLQRV